MDNRSFSKRLWANRLFFTIDRPVVARIAQFVQTEELATLEDSRSGKSVTG